jgi:predicted regulator of Ras-like GTPase activity (Roadblock/LC7/MglB family)
MSTASGPDEELLAELRRLRQAAPDVRGCLLASTDGLLIAEDSPTELADGVAALSAACLGVSQRIADTVGQQEFKEVVISSTGGYVAMYMVGGDAVLLMLATAGANVGRLNHEARRSAPVLARILQEAADAVLPEQVVEPAAGWLPPVTDRLPRRVGRKAG